MLRTHLLKQCMGNMHMNFTNLKKLNAHLAQRQQTYTVMYFRAKWNPQCHASDKIAQRLANQNVFLQLYQIDCDASERIKTHYCVKYEPQFVFCYLGDELLRRVGCDWEQLTSDCNKLVHFAETVDWGNTTKKWLPYGSRYTVYQKLVYAGKFNLYYSPVLTPYKKMFEQIK